MTGGLFDPLGTDRAERVRRAARPSAPAIAVCAMLLALAALLAVSWLRDSGDRGMPVAVGPIERPAPVLTPPAPAAVDPLPAALPPPAAPLPAPAAPSGLPASPPRDDQDVQIENGVRVVRPRRVQPAAPAAQPTARPPVQGGQTLRVPDGRAAR